MKKPSWLVKYEGVLIQAKKTLGRSGFYKSDVLEIDGEVVATHKARWSSPEGTLFHWHRFGDTQKLIEVRFGSKIGGYSPTCQIYIDNVHVFGPDKITYVTDEVGKSTVENGFIRHFAKKGLPFIAFLVTIRILSEVMNNGWNSIGVDDIASEFPVSALFAFIYTAITWRSCESRLETREERRLEAVSLRDEKNV